MGFGAGSGPRITRDRVMPFVRTFAAPTVSLVCVILLWDRFGSVDVAAVRQAVAEFTLAQWLVALAFTIVSYTALARFDGTCHRLVKTSVPMSQARRGGAVAFTLSQTLGVGLITGGLARWRLLPQLTLTQALALSGVAALAFMAIWAWFCAAVWISAPWIGGDTAAPLWQAPLFWAAHIGFGLCLTWPKGFGKWLRQILRRKGLGLRSLAGLSAYAIIDIFAAWAVLYVLLGDAASLGMVPVLTAFLVALGLGLISGAPAGLGAFELTMISMLPQADPSTLMAAITGYRLVYFVIPALAGAVILAKPDWLIGSWEQNQVDMCQPATLGDLPTALSDVLSTAPQAEAQLARQPGMGLLWSKSNGCGGTVGVTGRSLVLLRDPFPTDQTEEVLGGLASLARDRGLTPYLYKCSGRTAVAARHLGYQVHPISREAWLRPANYDLSNRSRRQLRRKVRAMEKANVEVLQTHTEALPWADMAQVNAAWSEAHGGERGFSMGRFHPSLVRHQRVYLAWHNSDLAGFITLHTCNAEWTLDLMRPSPDGPDGVAHALIHTALEDAKTSDIPRFSLAAAPLDSNQIPADRPLAKLQRELANRTGGAGLSRFKSLFDPHWQTLYAAAPNRWAILRGGAEIGRAISTPPPLPKTNMNTPQDNYDRYEIAS
ncbi:MAG: phosphatidylglycerol lysyltransferase domain-containing protein [Pseudomonadota bacterium]